MGSNGWIGGGWVLVGFRWNPGRSLSHWYLFFSFLFFCDLMVDSAVGCASAFWIGIFFFFLIWWFWIFNLWEDSGSVGCDFVALVTIGLCRWWMWVCGIGGCGFVPVMAVGVVVAAVVVIGGHCCGCGGCAVVVVVEELIYYFSVL